ncbi:MAG TPA: helix-turn-helix domain-containing protein [Terracidiphilus sp.]|nr:helix-turn-helix domain-containing protein [Terracidiphilus sp.]
MSKKPDSSSSPRGRPKGDKRERTRAKLLEAARQLVREKGYEQATLEEVAKRAGMTTGAIYGNFRNREELFVALGQAYWPAIKPQVKPGASVAEIMRAMAKATIAVMPDRKAAAIGRFTGIAYTLQHDELLRQVHEVTAQSYALGAEWLRGVADEGELPMPAEQMVRVIHALSEGLILHSLLTPDLFPKSLCYAAFDALAMAPKQARGRKRPE